MTQPGQMHRRIQCVATMAQPRGLNCVAPNLSVNYVLGDNTITSITAAAPNFVPGTFNACDNSDNSAIIPEVERHGGLVSLSQDLDDTTSVDIRAFYSERDSVAVSELTGQAQLPASFMVPAGLPPFIPGLRLNASYYSVKFTDILRTPTPNAGIFTDFPNTIKTNVAGISAADLRAFGMLAPGGTPVVETLILQGNLVYELVDFRTGNFGILRVEGIDFGLNYRTDTGFGGFDFALTGNYALARKSQVSPTSVVVDELEFNNPKLFLRGAVGADYRGFRAQAMVNHTGGYDIVPLPTVPVQDHVGSFTTIDLFFKYQVPGQSAILRDLSFTLNVKNVLDEDPPIFFGTAPNDNGFANGFTFGRMFVFGVKKKF